MTILLFHHAQGQTPGFLAFADWLRDAGHTVHAPDLYEGKTFKTVEDGVANAQAVGFAEIIRRGVASADALPTDIVYAGFSLGVLPAQKLVETRPGARGALFYHGCIPGGFGPWPAGMPVEIHMMEKDKWLEEDLDAAIAMDRDVPTAKLWLYPGSGHLFADAGSPDYDAAAAALLKERTLAFLRRLFVKILAGTSGFSFPEWKGSFYPADLAAKDMLRYYAERFPTVEINNTFYRLPTQAVLESWLEEVPDDFSFVLKCSQFITHVKRLKEPAAPLAVLFNATKALGPKLGASLFQLPPNMKKDVARFAEFLDALPRDKRIAIEFRHETWFDDEIFELLRRAGVALCVADTGEEPVAPLVATTDWGYLRLRREKFSDRELEAWVKRIGEQPWTDAYVFLKHEEGAIGPKLATRILELAAG